MAQADKELAFGSQIKRGDRGMAAKRVQEWLSFHGFATPVDSDFGEATERQVKAFQTARHLTANGVVTSQTWTALTEPLRRAVAPIAPTGADDIASMTLRYAKQHLAAHPIEIAGPNCGPWVRVYMGGNEGAQWLWCAGFVTTLLRSACEALGVAMPIRGSVSCDTLAAQAREKGRFVAGSRVADGSVPLSSLGKCSIFLVRRTATDWVHTGIAFEPSGDTFATIEGNTDAGGSSNGFEAARRVRNLTKKDYIRLI